VIPCSAPPPPCAAVFPFCSDLTLPRPPYIYLLQLRLAIHGRTRTSLRDTAAHESVPEAWSLRAARAEYPAARP
jgi:hypothetical protein